MQLKAIEKTSLVELVEQRILNIVRKNNLSIGDSLPAELELTEGLGVSRSVVREALSRLRMLGLLESRKKRGMVIAEPDVFGGCSQILDAAFLNEKTQRDLCEMRLTLELGLADLLFLRKTENDLNALEKIVHREEKARTEQMRLKLEIEFHTTLYQMGRNDLLLQFQALLEPFFRDAVKREERNGRRKGDASHRDLLEELRSGNPDGFRKKMRNHLQPHFVRLMKNLGTGDRP
jgi:GntR family transcriptional repressor for pyruvate dehydrogenase complex